MEVGFRSGLFQFLKSLISQMPIGILVLSTVINSLSVIRTITLISLPNLLSEAVILVAFIVSIISSFFLVGVSVCINACSSVRVSFIRPTTG